MQSFDYVKESIAIVSGAHPRMSALSATASQIAPWSERRERGYAASFSGWTLGLRPFAACQRS